MYDFYYAKLLEDPSRFAPRPGNRCVILLEPDVRERIIVDIEDKLMITRIPQAQSCSSAKLRSRQSLIGSRMTALGWESSINFQATPKDAFDFDF